RPRSGCGSNPGKRDVGLLGELRTGNGKWKLAFSPFLPRLGLGSLVNGRDDPAKRVDHRLHLGGAVPLPTCKPHDLLGGIQVEASVAARLGSNEIERALPSLIQMSRQLNGIAGAVGTEVRSEERRVGKGGRVQSGE